MAWKTSARLAGWFPAGGSAVAVAGGMILSTLTFLPETRLRLVETIIPLAMALTAAFLLSPEDEPSLELLLACPRPLAGALLERLAVATGMLGGVALAGNLVGLTFSGGDWLPLALARWAAPFVCLASVALFTTQLTRQGTFGALLGTLMWGGMLFGGDSLLTRWPFLWPLHVYLQPTAVPPAVYALNRATLTLAGLVLVALAAYLARDEERMLGIRSTRGGKAMKLKLAQLGGMIRYEVRMQWRRRGLPVVMVVFLVVLLLLGLALRALGREAKAEGATLPPDTAQQVARRQASFSIMYGTWPVALMLLILAIPPIVSETIPKDRQVGVCELLDSLPLSRGVYLTGKLLSLWTGMSVGLAGVSLLFGLAAWLLHGPHDLVAYLALWAIGVAPLALFTSGMSTLLSAGQPTRRRATFVGIAFAAYCVAMLVTTSGTLWDAVSLARPSVFLYLQFKYTTGFGLLSDLGLISYPPAQIPLTIGVGALQVALAWLIVWSWMRLKEGR